MLNKFSSSSDLLIIINDSSEAMLESCTHSLHYSKRRKNLNRMKDVIKHLRKSSNKSPVHQFSYKTIQKKKKPLKLTHQTM
jgi:hypothetical protein